MEYAKAMAKTASREHTRKRLGRSSRITAAPPKTESKPFNQNRECRKKRHSVHQYCSMVKVDGVVLCFRLGGLIHYSPVGLVFGLLSLPVEKIFLYATLFGRLPRNPCPSANPRW